MKSATDTTTTEDTMATTAPSFPLDGLRRHKLLTVAEIRELPALGSTDGQGKDAEAKVKLFCPYGRMTLYVTEFDGEDTLYGYMVSPLGPDCDEWGYSSLREFGEMALGTGTPAIERDKWFDPAPVGDCIEQRL